MTLKCTPSTGLQRLESPVTGGEGALSPQAAAGAPLPPAVLRTPGPRNPAGNKGLTLPARSAHETVAPGPGEPRSSENITAPGWGARLDEEPAKTLISEFKSTCSLRLISSNNVNSGVITFEGLRISLTFSSQNQVQCATTLKDARVKPQSKLKAAGSLEDPSGGGVGPG